MRLLLALLFTGCVYVDGNRVSVTQSTSEIHQSSQKDAKAGTKTK